MSKPQFTEDAWEDYLYRHQQDKRTVAKINKLIADIMRNGAMKGTGSPEPLKGNLHGQYARRINEKDRLIYRILEGDVIEVISCRGHYNDK